MKKEKYKIFDKKYFEHLYPTGETIDGDFNSNDHAQYLKKLFQLVGYHVQSIYDYGFGKGSLLKSVSNALECSRVGGCDVSAYALEKLVHKKFASTWSLEVSKIEKTKIPKKTYDLGLCNSVLQYVEDHRLDSTLRVIAKSCRYAYIHIPTLEDYKIFKKQMQFVDPYAYKRTQLQYRLYIKKYFVVVSYGLLESKYHVKHKSSCFEDSIYRF